MDKGNDLKDLAKKKHQRKKTKENSKYFFVRMLINSRGKIRLMLRNENLNNFSLDFFVSEAWKKKKKIGTDSKFVSKYNPKTKSGAGNGISNQFSNSGKHFDGSKIAPSSVAESIESVELLSSVSIASIDKMAQVNNTNFRMCSVSLVANLVLEEITSFSSLSINKTSPSVDQKTSTKNNSKSPRKSKFCPENLVCSKSQKNQSDESKLPTRVGKLKKAAKSGEVGNSEFKSANLGKTGKSAISVQGIAQEVSNFGHLCNANLITDTIIVPKSASSVKEKINKPSVGTPAVWNDGRISLVGDHSSLTSSSDVSIETSKLGGLGIDKSGALDSGSGFENSGVGAKLGLPVGASSVPSGGHFSLTCGYGTPISRCDWLIKTSKSGRQGFGDRGALYLGLEFDNSGVGGVFGSAAGASSGLKRFSLGVFFVA